MGAGVMAARQRAVPNPLALAVLACLRERPMHPYEMAATMRSRGKEHSIKLNYGSLYTVVNNLAARGFIETAGTQREGARPERTVYRLTGAGRAELEDRMSELVATPVKEYPRFEAALSLLPVLGPGEAIARLRDRISALEATLTAERAALQAAAALPRLFVIEEEYRLAMLEAELAWVRGLVADLEAGALGDLEMWRRLHEADVIPPDVDWTRQSAGPARVAGPAPGTDGLPGPQRPRREREGRQAGHGTAGKEDAGRN